MDTRPFLLAETTFAEVKGTSYHVAVLPWGATEAHNYHLPYGTDNVECDHIASESARLAWQQGAKVIVLPTIPFGVNTGQLDIPLDMNMNPSTQAAVLRDVADSLVRAGIPKLVILNGHGGNDFRQMIRELSQHVGLFLCTLDWYTCVDPAEFFEESGDHAGELETSVMLHIVPDLVRPLEEAGPGTARTFTITALRERWAWSQRQWTRVTTDTGVGNPKKSSPVKGKKYFEAVTRKIASFLVELARTNVSDMYA